jgi:hypothetical protein
MEDVCASDTEEEDEPSGAAACTPLEDGCCLIPVFQPMVELLDTASDVLLLLSPSPPMVMDTLIVAVRSAAVLATAIVATARDAVMGQWRPRDRTAISLV